MSGVLKRGLVTSVWYREASAEIFIDGWLAVPEAEADKALAAKREKPPREIEIVHGDGSVQTRTVRLMPVVTIKARGIVSAIYDEREGCDAMVRLRETGLSYHIANVMGVQIRQEVEIVSIDGARYVVRRVS